MVTHEPLNDEFGVFVLYLLKLSSDELCSIEQSPNGGSFSLLRVDARDIGPGIPVDESSTPSSIGDDIDWKLFIRILDDAIDSSPSVIEPNAESCDDFVLVDIFMPRIEYSIRRLFKFFIVHDSVVSWLEKAAHAVSWFSTATAADVVAVGAVDDRGEDELTDGEDENCSSACKLFSQKWIGDVVGGNAMKLYPRVSKPADEMITSSSASSESLMMSNESIRDRLIWFRRKKVNFDKNRNQWRWGWFIEFLSTSKTEIERLICNAVLISIYEFIYIQFTVKQHANQRNIQIDLISN